MKYWIIYILICPVDEEVRYVGITSVALDTRLRRHLHDKYDHEKFMWISWLHSLDLIPEIDRIDECYGDRHDAEIIERQYVWYYLMQGCRLFNRKYVLGGDDFIEHLKQGMSASKMPKHQHRSAASDMTLQ